MSGSTCTDSCRRPSPSQAHCGACHRTLGSVTDFDRHRVGGACVDPASLGLVERAGLWASPERHADDERKTAVLRQSRRFRARHTHGDALGAVAGPVIPSKIHNSDPAHGGGEAA